MRRNLTVGGFFGVLLILTLAIGSLGLSAQAQSNTSTPPPTPSGTVTPPTLTPLPTLAVLPTFTTAPVSITIWHNWQGTQADALTTIVKQFQTAHPDIGITVRAISGDLKAQYQAATQAQHGPELLI